MRTFILILGVVCLMTFDAYVIYSARTPTDRPPPEERQNAIVVSSSPKSTPATVSSRPVVRFPSPVVPAGTNEALAPRVVKPVVSEKSWPHADAIAGEFVLSFFDENDRSRFIELAKKRGGEILDLMELGHSVRLRGKDDKWLADLLRETPRPLDSAPNFYTRIPELFGRTSEAPEYNYRSFGNLALRWMGVSGDCSAWGKGVVVAVLDTGVETHPSLAEPNITRVSESTALNDKGDLRGHATAVASLLAGNMADMAGVAPAARILSIQVLGADGTGDAFTLAKGIVDAVDRGAKIINLSLGTHSDCFLLKQAVDYARGQGVGIVAAVGNDGLEGAVFPARYNGVIAVSAVDASGRHLYFANRGPEVTLSAPGLDVKAATPGEGVTSFSGTSAAVPFVSGAVAVLLSQNPQMTLGEAVETLCKYSNDTGAPGKDEETGNGILNVGWALNRNVSGLYDVAVCTPHLHPRASRDDDVIVTPYIQNRGTENLRHVQMRVSIGFVEETLDFYDIAVGKTASHDFRVNPEAMRQPGGVALLCSATIDGAEDINPADNALKTTLYLRPDPAPKADTNTAP